MSTPRTYRGLRVDNGEWVKGWYLYRNCVNNDTHYIAIRAGLYHRVIPASVGQYTGLKDRNGKGMDWWEDDILQPIDGSCRIGIITYNEHFARYEVQDEEGGTICSLGAAWVDGWQKQGDIHTTPELLEGK